MKRYLLSLLLLAAASPVAAASYVQTNVRIETADRTIYSGDVYISSDGCTVRDTDNANHTVDGAMAVCALKEAGVLGGFDYELQDSSYGLYLNSVDGELPSSFGDYWSFFVNYTAASVGLSDYELQNGDEMILSLGGYPNNALQLRLPSKQVLVNEKMVVRVKANGEAIAGATVHFGDVTKTTDSLGKARFTPKDATNALNVYATADGATRTPTATIRVMRRYTENTTVTGAEQTTMLTEAANFLTARVADDGLISDSQSVTDWAAISLAQANVAMPTVMLTAVLDYDPTANDAYATAEIARHILAVEALGYDARNEDGVDYVARLLNTKSNNQFGDEAYVNDDIFAGLALLAAGEATDSTDVAKAVAAAKDSVNADGGVSYAVAIDESDNDTTAVFVQLLSLVGDDSKVYRQAMHYLVAQQNLDGGWGYDDHGVSNSSSTSTVLQALHAAGRTPNKVRSNHQTGYNFLVYVQASSGAFDYDTIGSYSYKTLNSAYAISALAHAWLGMVN